MLTDRRAGLHFALALQGGGLNGLILVAATCKMRGSRPTVVVGGARKRKSEP